MRKKINYSIIIPCYKDSDKLRKNLPELSVWASKRGDIEIIVVDDGSGFDSYDIKRVCGFLDVRNIFYYTNEGKWFAIRIGRDSAIGRFIIISDADLSVNPREVIEEFEKLDCPKNTILIGDRNKFQVGIPLKRRLFGKFFSKVSQYLVFNAVGLRVFDSQCPAKCIPNHNRIWKRLKENRFSGDVEVITIARELGYRIKSFDCHYSNDVNSKVKPFKDGSEMLDALWRIRERLFNGEYR